MGALKQNTTACREAISRNSVYLEDEAVRVLGLNLYGTPWTPSFGRLQWAFQAKRGGKRLERIWRRIPDDVDILISHAPPLMHGDLAESDGDGDEDIVREHQGEQHLLRRVREIGTVQFHVFAHIHEGYGASKEEGLDTVFVNTAMLDRHYQELNKPIMFYVK